MRTPYHLLPHTASIDNKNITRENSMDVGLTSQSATTTRCRVEDVAGSESIVTQRLSGTRIALGYFPAGTAIVTQSILSVTGKGFAAATKYECKSPLKLAAGDGALYVCDLEAISS